MNITAQHIAKYHAEQRLGNLNYDVIVVSESGDVCAGGDLQVICDEFDEEQKKYFIIKGAKAA